MGSRRVAGVDSSTQSTKVVVVDAGSGELVHSAAARHPEVSEVWPQRWWEALGEAGGRSITGARALSITSQQHTTILLDRRNEVLRPAILWNDLRAMASGADLVRELGPDRWLRSPGLLPDSAHPVSKLRWLREHEPETAAQVETVLLPHDWLTWSLLGRVAPPSTDRSDASSTGYWSIAGSDYDDALLRHSFGRAVRTPEVLPPDAPAGASAQGLLIGAGCGDNAATHLALATDVGDMVISVGTSATVSMRTTSPVLDPTGRVDTMADARSGAIPIIAMLNGARVLVATASMLGITPARLDKLAAGAEPTAGGAVMLPYLDGERNPPRQEGRGALLGLSRPALTPEMIARAAVLGLACAIADAADALARAAGEPRRILLVGGGAKSRALRQALVDLTGRTIHTAPDREHAAFGAARQAAWVLTGTLPHWPLGLSPHHPSAGSGAWAVDVRAAHRAAGLGRPAGPAADSS
ncbi:FGGY-family carbohydrate kinase [Brachybacterium sp. GCM10030252]|uniref:xylulokinase n=1 Tax=Brachybacterium sp. GCM10030252 TaxID=3273380 RepID=UPI00361E40EE